MSTGAPTWRPKEDTLIVKDKANNVLLKSSIDDAPEDKCYSNPCVNGGTCSTLGDEYKCSCAPGFTGQFRFQFEKHFISVLPVI